MSPELIKAVKERIAVGQSEEVIREELRNAGYGEQAIDEVLLLARSTAPYGEVPVAPVGSMVELPPFGRLFKESFTYAWQHLSLVGWVLLLGIAPLALLVMVAVSLGLFIGSMAVMVVGLVGLLVIISLGLIINLAVQYIVAHDDVDTPVSFKTGFAWARRHLFWSGLSVVVLLSLVTNGAITLLLIPYLVIVPFLSFVLFAYVKEGFTGFSAIFRARELGRGNWWPLLWRKSLLSLIMALPLIILMILLLVPLIGYFIALAFADPMSLSDTVMELLSGYWQWILLAMILIVVYSTFCHIWKVRFSVLLFRNLTVARPVTPASGTGTDKWKYIALVVVGVLSLLSSSSDQEDDPSWGELLDESAEEIEIVPPEVFKERARDLRTEPEIIIPDESGLFE